MAKRVREPKARDVAPAGGPTVTGEQRETSQIVRANIEREVTTAPGFATLYTNDTQVQVSPWDIRIIFGEISEPPTPERRTIRIKTTGEVRMSPQHAKKLATILIKQLELYERSVGPIPMPTD